MTDKELLELAARASGHFHYLRHPEGLVIEGRIWNSLTSDADAFRLAVKLQITIAFHNDAIAAMHLSSGRSWTEKYSNENYAATRRAITRAAAAIGEERGGNN